MNLVGMTLNLFEPTLLGQDHGTHDLVGRHASSVDGTQDICKTWGFAGLMSYAELEWCF